MLESLVRSIRNLHDRRRRDPTRSGPRPCHQDGRGCRSGPARLPIVRTPTYRNWYRSRVFFRGRRCTSDDKRQLTGSNPDAARPATALSPRRSACLGLSLALRRTAPRSHPWPNPLAVLEPSPVCRVSAVWSSLPGSPVILLGLASVAAKQATTLNPAIRASHQIQLAERALH